MEVEELGRPYISILVTSYNREKYIADCLLSILSSSYQNFEIIVLDDASTDNTTSIVEGFVKTDNRIRLIINSSNLGQFRNRNKAITFAKYNYVKFFDSDDLMYSHCLEVFVQAIKVLPDAGLFTIAHQDTLDKKLPIIYLPEEAYINHYLKGQSVLYVGPSGTMYSKSQFLEVGGFDEKMGILADGHLNLKLAAKYPLIAVCPNTFYYRSHTDQVTEGQKDYLRMIQERYLIDLDVLSNPSCPLKKKMLEIVLNKVKKRFGLNLLKNLFKSGEFKKIRTIMKNCRFSIYDFVNVLYK